MKFHSLRPILYTTEVKDTIGFYTDVIGFTLENYNEDWEWASLKRDHVEIMVTKPNSHISFTKPVFTGSFYIITDEVDKLWEKLKTRTRVCYEIETFEWDMREFAIYDNNGYIIQFGQEV